MKMLAAISGTFQTSQLKWNPNTQKQKMSENITPKQGYLRSHAGRLHMEEILKVLEKTRELLEGSLKDMDERIMEAAKDRKEFEELEEKFLHQMLEETEWLKPSDLNDNKFLLNQTDTPKPWHG